MSVEHLQALIKHEQERALRLKLEELKRQNDIKEASLYRDTPKYNNTHQNSGHSWDCYDEDGSWLGSL